MHLMMSTYFIRYDRLRFYCPYCLHLLCSSSSEYLLLHVTLGSRQRPADLHVACQLCQMYQYASQAVRAFTQAEALYGWPFIPCHALNPLNPSPRKNAHGCRLGSTGTSCWSWPILDILQSWERGSTFGFIRIKIGKTCPGNCTCIAVFTNPLAHPGDMIRDRCLKLNPFINLA
jgi:hypothetical protein